MKNKSIKNYGTGIGLRHEHFPVFLNERDLPNEIGFVEVISENYMNWEKREIISPLLRLLKVRKNFPVALHGVSLSIGSTTPPKPSYLKRLKELSEKVEPIIISDHLCFTGLEENNLHDLLPLPYTEECLKVVCEHILITQDFLKRPLLLENPSSYLSFNNSTMSESEFLKQIAQKTQCGLLLDINNIYVSGKNHLFDPFDYIRNIPPESVVQYHLAGHSLKEGYLLDTHDADVCDEVWELYRFALKVIGKRSVMIERDSKIPPWSEMKNELLKCSQITREHVLTS